ncbi:MAG: helix-turn-helix transcriptional regulator [Acidobacteriota bacterium]|jgi:transcriptional regulator with XRE-family HTH domain|nr:helix-turn-helix transcriptional regulator [Acidobacteriota bacterium]
MDQQVEIGRRIRSVRQERGMTQDALAAAIGVSRSAVAQWETGRAGQLTGHLVAIARALDVGVDFVMHGADKRGPALTASADELALLRLYRECADEDRQFLLRTARRMARLNTRPSPD